MAKLPKRRCRVPGCPEMVYGGDRYCPDHAVEHERVRDRRRPSATVRGYNNPRWRRLRRTLLARAEYAVCAMCGRASSTVLDHIVPMTPDNPAFWRPSSLQGLCAPCHGIKTAAEDGGFGNPRRTP